MKKRIFALAAIAALAFSAAACNTESKMGQEFTDEDKAMHEQYTKGFMIEQPGEEEGGVVTHFYACDDENTIASYGFNAASNAEGSSVSMEMCVTGAVEMQEDGTFKIADADGMITSVYKAEFQEDGTLNLVVDDIVLESMPSVGPEAVVKYMTENAGFHMSTN
ncbi:MAG: hypothetical protein Q4C06_04440 [Bacillota bacterium]|nr:hypothetical protein [Bacillota bacterium]